MGPRRLHQWFPSQNKGPGLRSFDVFSFVSLNMLLNSSVAGDSKRFDAHVKEL